MNKGWAPMTIATGSGFQRSFAICSSRHRWPRECRLVAISDFECSIDTQHAAYPLTRRKDIGDQLRAQVLDVFEYEQRMFALRSKLPHDGGGILVSTDFFLDGEHVVGMLVPVMLQELMKILVAWRS
jgi:hypothetical protein